MMAKLCCAMPCMAAQRLHATQPALQLLGDTGWRFCGARHFCKKCLASELTEVQLTHLFHPDTTCPAPCKVTEMSPPILSLSPRAHPTSAVVWKPRRTSLMAMSTSPANAGQALQPHPTKAMIWCATHCKSKNRNNLHVEVVVIVVGRVTSRRLKGSPLHASCNSKACARSMDVGEEGCPPVLAATSPETVLPGRVVTKICPGASAKTRRLWNRPGCFRPPTC